MTPLAHCYSWKRWEIPCYSYPRRYQGTAISTIPSASMPPGHAALHTNLFSVAGYQNNVIALETTISDIHGGPEIFVMRNVAGGIGQVPEPGSMLLLSGGLIGLALLRLRP